MLTVSENMTQPTTEQVTGQVYLEMKPKDLALASIIEPSPKGHDIVHAKCCVCGQVSLIKFRYVKYNCWYSGKSWKCKTCSHQEMLINPELKAKRIESHQKTWTRPEYRTKMIQNKDSRILALSCIEEKNPMLKDIVNVRCNICNNIFKKEFRYVIKCCRNSHKPYRCRACSGREVQSRPEVHQKASATNLRNGSSSRAVQSMWQNPRYREKLCNINKITANTKLGRQQRSIQSKQAWTNPDYHTKMVEIGRKTHVTPDFTLEVRKLLSEKTKQNWLDPIYRERCLKGAQKARNVALTTRISSLNKKVFEILNTINIKYEAEYKIGPYSFDLFIPEHKLLIEIQGEYWHSLPQNLVRDKQKATYVESYFPDLKLSYVLEIEFSNMEALRSKIYNLLHLKGDQIQFEFNQVIIRSIDHESAYQFLSQWHYLHGLNASSICFGGFLNNKLISVCCFSIPRNSERDKKVIELSRFCIHPNHHQRNFASYFMVRCIKLLPNNYSEIIAFADTTHDHFGSIYKATNFRLVSEVKPDYWYMNNDGWIYHKRTIYERAVKMGYTESEYVLEHNLIKCLGKKKLKYSLERKVR